MTTHVHTVATVQVNQSDRSQDRFFSLSVAKLASTILHYPIEMPVLGEEPQFWPLFVSLDCGMDVVLLLVCANAVQLGLLKPAGSSTLASWVL